MYSGAVVIARRLLYFSLVWRLNPHQVEVVFFKFLSALGAAYGTAKSGTGIAAMSVMRPDLIMKSVIPVVMAGIIAIYGLVVSVLVANKREWNLCNTPPR